MSLDFGINNDGKFNSVFGIPMNHKKGNVMINKEINEALEKIANTLRFSIIGLEKESEASINELNSEILIDDKRLLTIRIEKISGDED